MKIIREQSLHMESNRFKISSTFFVGKAVMLVLAIYSAYGIFHYAKVDPFDVKGLVINSLCVVIGVVLFWLFSRVAVLEYDDIERILYVKKSGQSDFEEIPLKNIDQITLSPVSPGNGQSAYMIRYRDNLDGYQSVLFVPKIFSRYSRMIKEDAQIENPNVYIRNWTFGV